MTRGGDSVTDNKQLQHDDHVYDVTVIGAGPIGMFAAFYAATRNLDFQLVESLPHLGGQVATLYPEKKIHDIAGFVSGTGEQLIANLKAQLDEFSDRIGIHTNEEVVGVERPAENAAADSRVFALTTSKRVFRTRTVLIAMGSGAFTPRPLAVDYDHALDNDKVFYFVKHIADFADLDVAVAGGGDAAIDWALTLEPIARSVTLIHRRDNFRALESSVDALKSSSVRILTPYKFASVAKRDDRLSIELNQVKGAETKELQVDALLVNYGFTSDNHLLKEWGLPVKRGDLEVNEYRETAVPGIYGIGDAVTYPGKVKLISAGFGEAPGAINHIAETLYPDRKQPLHE